MINYILKAWGHPHVSSQHRTTLEITWDKEIGKQADCIVGVKADRTMLDFPEELKSAISRDDALIRVILSTNNNWDEIKGQGHHKLSLDHPTDIVCRKSEFICSRTLMIKADKAACDLNPDLIEDLKAKKELKVEIRVD